MLCCDPLPNLRLTGLNEDWAALGRPPYAERTPYGEMLAAMVEDVKL